MTKLYCYREVSHKTLEIPQTHTVSPTRVELNVEKLITLLYFFSLMETSSLLSYSTSRV